MTIRERVTIKRGGVIELTDPSLPEGEEAEVTVVLEGEKPPRPLWQRIVDIGASVPAGEWEKAPRDLAKNLGSDLS